MLTDEAKKRLSVIKERDSEYGDDMPKHWVAQWDRRYLLLLIGDLLEELENRTYVN